MLAKIVERPHLALCKESGLTLESLSSLQFPNGNGVVDTDRLSMQRGFESTGAGNIISHGLREIG